MTNSQLTNSQFFAALRKAERVGVNYINNKAHFCVSFDIGLSYMEFKREIEFPKTEEGFYSLAYNDKKEFITLLKEGGKIEYKNENRIVYFVISGRKFKADKLSPKEFRMLHPAGWIYKEEWKKLKLLAPYCEDKKSTLREAMKYICFQGDKVCATNAIELCLLDFRNIRGGAFLKGCRLDLFKEDCNMFVEEYEYEDERLGTRMEFETLLDSSEYIYSERVINFNYPDFNRVISDMNYSTWKDGGEFHAPSPKLKGGFTIHENGKWTYNKLECYNYYREEDVPLDVSPFESLEEDFVIKADFLIHAKPWLEGKNFKIFFKKLSEINYSPIHFKTDEVLVLIMPRRIK